MSLKLMDKVFASFHQDSISYLKNVYLSCKKNNYTIVNFKDFDVPIKFI